MFNFFIYSPGKPPHPQNASCFPGSQSQQTVLTAQELNEEFKEILKIHADLITITMDQKHFHMWAVPRILELENRMKKFEDFIKNILNKSS